MIFEATCKNYTFKLWFFLLTLSLAGPEVFGALEVEAEDMILVPEGPFIMGSSDEDIFWAAKQFHSESLDWYRDETPAHSVTLPAFEIDKYEVSVGDYKLYMEATGRPAPREFVNARLNHPLQPVVSVSWQDAKDYCLWSNKRLPTELEWEKAARGTRHRRAALPLGHAFYGGRALQRL